jgi:hypothetical protein
MKRILLQLLIFAAALSGTVSAQAVRTPEKGSAERTAILNTLRVPVERELKQKIVFNLDHFRVAGNWAFLGGDPQTPSGGQPDYRRTPYQRDKDADMFDNNIFALLRKTGGKWRVVHYAIGCTDVCYADWWRRYKAPKAVFPYTE